MGQVKVLGSTRLADTREGTVQLLPPKAAIWMEPGTPCLLGCTQTFGGVRREAKGRGQRVVLI